MSQLTMDYCYHFYALITGFHIMSECARSLACACVCRGGGAIRAFYEHVMYNNVIYLFINLRLFFVCESLRKTLTFLIVQLLYN